MPVLVIIKLLLIVITVPCTFIGFFHFMCSLGFTRMKNVKQQHTIRRKE